MREDRRRTQCNQAMGMSSMPVDHGWAWIVMLGGFMNITFIMTFLRSTALLFIQFLEKYQESATLTTLAFGLCSAMFALCNIFGPTVLLHRFEVRTLAVIGAAINFLSIFIIAFAPNMILIDFMMACLGFSHGLISVPQMTLIGHYFKKRLSFATAFVNLGLSIATIAGPLLTQFLLDTYGLQGAIIILAGINMNCIPASMLLRPVSQYTQTDLNIVILRDKENLINKENNECRVSKGVIDEVEGKKDTLEDRYIKQNMYEESEVKTKEEIMSLIRKKSDMKPQRVRSVSESTSKDVTTETSISTDTSPAAFTKSDLHIKMSDHRESVISDLIDKVSVSSSIRYLSNPYIFIETSTSKEEIHHNNELLAVEDFALKAVHTGSNAPQTDEVSLKSTSNESLEQASKRGTCLGKIRKSVSQSIYVHPLAILLLLGTGIGVHTQSSIAYMPAAGRENGLTDDEVPYLITVIGVCDLVSKLAIGVFADLGYVKRIHIAIGSEICVGVLVQFVQFFHGFGLMILLQVGLGLTVGVMHAMVAVITVDILGLKHMGHIMAGYFLINGFILTADHLVIGTLKDLTGSFLMGYNYIGSLVLLSAFLLLLEPLVAKVKPVPTF